MVGRLSIPDLPEIFADLDPVPVGDEGVAAIDYSEPFRVAYGYMRAVWKVNEQSERALKLTATCLQLNPANYTVWHFRRLCLEHVYNKDLVYIPEELALASSLGGDNPKNYQIWYHRRTLLERLPTLSEYCQSELSYISSVLKVDGKNYHAWSHRQWLVGTFKNDTDDLWNNEVQYVNGLLKEDVRNNSAWNHRWLVVHQGGTTSTKKLLTPDEAGGEMEYALNAAARDPYNESSWRYFLAVLKEQVFELHDAEMVLALLSRSKERVENVKCDTPSAHQMTAILEILEWVGDAESVREAIRIAESLADEHDVIRQKYWRFRVNELQHAVEKAV